MSVWALTNTHLIYIEKQAIESVKLMHEKRKIDIYIISGTSMKMTIYKPFHIIYYQVFYKQSLKV